MSTQFTNRQWRLPNNENKDKQSNYSMDFASSRVNLGTSLDLGTNSTISLWINSNILNYVILGESTNTKGSQTYLNGQIIYVKIGSVFKAFTHSMVTGQWYNIVVIRQGGSIEVFQNNTSLGTQTGYPTSINTLCDTIGAKPTGASPYNGKIDSVSFFDYALSSSQVTTLYGSSSTGIGNPMSLSPKPVAYYPLGDQDAFNGANYLVPNIAAEEADGDIATSYSPYALDFDGANDYINVPNSTDFDFGTADFTWSFWLNYETHANNAGILYTGANSSHYRLKFRYSGQIIFLQNSQSDTQIADLGTNIEGTGWHHIALVRNSGTITTFLDGSQVDSSVRAGDINSGGNDFRIAYNNVYLNGQMSNVSIWNAALTSAQVTEIYSEGVPSNLNNHSAYSNLVSWWQLGSNSSFNTNWTVLDEKGTNNGESVNMTEDDIVDGVGSYANGLSSGMGGDEVIGDAPYSSSNSLSVNMDVLDRVTDTPS